MFASLITLSTKCRRRVIPFHKRAHYNIRTPHDKGTAIRNLVFSGWSRICRAWLACQWHTYGTAARTCIEPKARCMAFITNDMAEKRLNDTTTAYSIYSCNRWRANSKFANPQIYRHNLTLRAHTLRQTKLHISIFGVGTMEARCV